MLRMSRRIWTHKKVQFETVIQKVLTIMYKRIIGASSPKFTYSTWIVLMSYILKSMFTVMYIVNLIPIDWAFVNSCRFVKL